MNNNVLTVNVYLSLIQMYLEGIKNYDSADKTKKAYFDEAFLGKKELTGLIHKTIKTCNKFTPFLFDDLSTRAQATVAEMEMMGFQGINVTL